jgi:predicted secreted protein
MADTEVRIVDAAGNLVKKLVGNGGEVVWDMKNAQGQRVASGVYTVLCNTADGRGHSITNILVMN